MGKTATLDPPIDACLLRLALAAKPYRAPSGERFSQWVAIVATGQHEYTTPALVFASPLPAARWFWFLRCVHAKVNHPLHACDSFAVADEVESPWTSAVEVTVTTRGQDEKRRDHSDAQTTHMGKRMMNVTPSDATAPTSRPSRRQPCSKKTNSCVLCWRPMQMPTGPNNLRADHEYSCYLGVWQQRQVIPAKVRETRIVILCNQIPV